MVILVYSVTCLNGKGHHLSKKRKNKNCLTFFYKSFDSVGNFIFCSSKCIKMLFIFNAEGL